MDRVRHVWKSMGDTGGEANTDPAGGTLPCFFFSHGSTAMLGRRSAPAAYWEQVGRQALEQGVERIVIMGARESQDGLHRCSPQTGRLLTTQSASQPTPSRESSPSHGESCACGQVLTCRVDPKQYQNFDLNPDVEFASRVRDMLDDAGINASLDPDFEQIHDTLYVQSQSHLRALLTTVKA